MKKILVGMLIVTVLVGMVKVSSAVDYTADTDNAQVPVTYSQASVFSVRLPESFPLSGSASGATASGNITVSGDILPTETVSVTAKDDDSTATGINVILTNAVNPEDRVVATVAMPEAVYTSAQVLAGTTRQCSVSASGFRAGTFSGHVTFVIKLNN